MMRSYGSTLFSPGTETIGAEPSIGAQVTSAMAIASRLLSASDMRPSTDIRPMRRHSSVIPSNTMPGLPPTGTDFGPASRRVSGRAAFLRRRKLRGKALLLGRARVVANRLDDGGIGERGRVAKSPALGDVTQESPHDLPGAGLREVWREEQELRLGNR